MEGDRRIPLKAFFLKSKRTETTMNEKNGSASWLLSFHQTGDLAH